nr:WD40 repeat domain-containing protein [Pseudarthrobacter sulfonivorans]
MDDATGELVGILTEGSEAGRFDRFLGIRGISKIFEGLPTRWVFAGEEARTHVTRRALGHLSNDAREGDLFTGREAALAKISEWLETGHEVGRPLVLTGQPGAGKSAVLGRAALLGERLGLRAGLVFHARSATYPQFLDGVRQVMDLDRDEDVLVGLQRGVPARGLAVMVDALDEAATHRDAEQIAGTLAGVAGVPGVAVVVATRPGAAGRTRVNGALLSLLNVPGAQASNLMDLDSDPYFDPIALATFAASLLTQEEADFPYPADGAWPRYREDQQLTYRLAKAIADRAAKNYLVAALTAVFLSENLPVVDPDAPDFDPRQLPAKIGEALDKVIDRQPEAMARLTRGLLTALAHAEGSGISDDLWLGFANALHYEAGPASLRDFKTSAVADFLLETSTDGVGGITRLFHQALTDELLNPSDRRDAAAIYKTILAHVSEVGGWARADDYALTHAPAHALKAGQLAEFLTDSEVLAHCNSALLTSVILEDDNVRKSPIGHTFIRAAGHLMRLPPGRERIDLLSLTAAHLGIVVHLKKSRGWAVTWAHSLGQSHQLLTGHTGTVAAVAVGRLGGADVVLSGGADGSVRVWDEHGAPTGKPLEGHQYRVNAVAVGRLGGREVVVSAGWGPSLCIWNEHGAPIANPFKGHKEGVYAVGRLAGHNVFVSAGWDGYVRVWDEHGTPIGKPLEGHQNGVNAVAVGRLGGREVVVSAGWGPGLCIWDELGAPIGRKLLEGHRETVHAVAVGRLGGRDVVVSAGWDGSVRVWDERGAPIGKPLVGHRESVHAVVVGRLGGRDVVVSGGRDGSVRVWDERGAPVGSPFKGHQNEVNAIAVGRLGGRDVVISAGADGIVRVWEEQGAPIGHPLEGHWDTVYAVAVGRLGGRDVVVSGGRDGSVRVWDERGAPIGKPMEGHRESVYAVAVGRLHGRDVVVSGGEYGSVRVWDEHGTPIGNPLKGLKSKVVALAVAPLGGRDVVVAAGWNGSIRIWNARGSPIGKPRSGHIGWMYALAVGRLGGRDVLVSAGWDGSVRVWDEHGTPIGNPLRGHQSEVYAVAVGRLGGRDVVLSGGADGTVRVWDEQGAPIGKPLVAQQDSVFALAVGRLGGRDVIVSVGQDGSVRVWDEYGAPVGNQLTFLAEVRAIALGDSVLAVATGHSVAHFKWD